MDAPVKPRTTSEMEPTTEHFDASVGELLVQCDQIRAGLESAKRDLSAADSVLLKYGL